MTRMQTFFLAQGRGSRWTEREWVRYGNVPAHYPAYKQLLPIKGEPLLCRSVRYFQEVFGQPATVVAGHELLALTGLESIGLTMPDPTDDVLTAVYSLITAAPDYASTWLFILGDVLLSRQAVRLLMYGVISNPSGVLARVGPSTVTTKAADEVFAMWLSGGMVWEAVRRIGRMFPRVPNLDRLPLIERPSKPWGFPFLACPQLEVVQAAYDNRKSLGLGALSDFITSINDYTDDVDSTIEYMQFWPAMEAAALLDP